MASLFKYLPQEYVQAFIGEGSAWFRPLAYYRSIEDKEVRGDLYEGHRVYRPELDLDIHRLNTNEYMNGGGFRFYSKARERDIFVFCIHSSELGRCVKASDAYNNENCALAARLLQQQPGVTTRFWCEKGTFKK